MKGVTILFGECPRSNVVIIATALRRACLVNVLSRSFIALFAVFALTSYQGNDELVISPGVGVPGVVELGWTKEQLFARLDRTKEKKIKWRGCVRWTEYRLEYRSSGFYVKLDRSDHRERKDPVVNGVVFDTSFTGTVAGLRIGNATRSEVYERFGVNSDYYHPRSDKIHNPHAYYDSLGIGFEFDCNMDEEEPLNERLIQIEIYPVQGTQ